MKHAYRWVYCLVGLLCSLGAQAQYKVATVVANITPCNNVLQAAGQCDSSAIDLGTTVFKVTSGGPTGVATAVESPLEARVLLIENTQGARVALVTLDLVTIPLGFADSVRNLVHSQPGMSTTGVLLNASHTHGGPVLVPFRLSGDPAPTAAYLTALKQRIAAAIYTASQHLVDASLRVTPGESTIGAYRRFDDRIRTPVYRQRLDVLQARDAQGHLLAVAYFTGCHAVAYMKAQGIISSDFPGRSRTTVEAALKNSSPNVKAFFFQGFAGEINPQNTNGEEVVGSDSTAKNVVGDRLAGEVLTTLNRSAGSWTLNGSLALQQATKQLTESLTPASGSPTTTFLPVETDVLTLGVSSAGPGAEWTFLFSSHEVVAEYAASVRSHFAVPEAVTLAGYSNSQHSYLPTQRMQENDQDFCTGDHHYEGCSSFSNYDWGALGKLRPRWHDDEFFAHQGTLVDDFTQHDGAKWITRTYLFTGTTQLYGVDTVGGFPRTTRVPVNVLNGQLQIFPQPGHTGLNYNGFASISTYNFTGRAAAVELVSPPNNGQGAEFFFALERDRSNWVAFNYHEGSLWVYTVVNGVMQWTSVASYSATNHRYLRMRHNVATNRLHWEASPDQGTWTSLYDMAPPTTLSLAAVRIELLGGTYGYSYNPGEIKLDNFSLSAPDVPDLATFFDDFDGAAVNPAKWNNGTSVLTGSVPFQDSTVSAVQSGGTFTITPLTGSYGLHYNGLQSVHRYDLTNREVSMEIKHAPVAQPSGAELFLFLTHDASNYYA